MSSSRNIRGRRQEEEKEINKTMIIFVVVGGSCNYQSLHSIRID